MKTVDTLVETTQLLYDTFNDKFTPNDGTAWLEYAWRCMQWDEAKLQQAERDRQMPRADS